MEVAEPSGGWGVNVGGFIEAHRDWVIRGALNGFGYTAQAKAGGRAKGKAGGRAKGAMLIAVSLDELAAKIRAAGQGSAPPAVASGPLLDWGLLPRWPVRPGHLGGGLDGCQRRRACSTASPGSQVISMGVMRERSGWSCENAGVRARPDGARPRLPVAAITSRATSANSRRGGRSAKPPAGPGSSWPG
jgi:hypothetical protein